MSPIFSLACAAAIAAAVPANAYDVESASAETVRTASPVLSGERAVWAPVRRPDGLDTGAESALVLPPPASPLVLTQATGVPETQVLTAEAPVTVAIDTAAGTVLRTGFAGLSGAGAPAVHVFIGKPDADAGTSVEDPHYAGSVAFYPVPLDGSFTSTQNLAPVLDRIGAAGETTVTYVMSAGGESAGVEIADVELMSAP